MSEKTLRALFWFGVVLVPFSFFLGLYGYLITPPGEGTVHLWHLSDSDKYDEYFDDTKMYSFDYDHWHRDWIFGLSIQILAAVLFFVGGILALVTYRADSDTPVPQASDGEISSWSLPPPKPRRQRRRWKLPILSRRLKITAGAYIVFWLVVLLVVAPMLRTYASGPRHSAIISVTIEDNQMLIWEGEFWIYVDEDEAASGILKNNPIVGSGQTTVNITVTWQGDSAHPYNVACWYNGRMRGSEIWVEDQRATSVYFDVGFH